MYNPYESGNWNVAQGYSNNLILHSLMNCSDYESIATFGTTNIGEEFSISEETKIMARIKGLNWLNKELEKLINQTLFAVKKSDKEKMYKFLDLVLKLRKELPHTYILVKNNINKTNYYKIYEDKFDNYLSMMVDIKREVMPILNSSKLIFPMEENLDPDEIKRRIFEDYVNAG